jgi:glycosyltransferase involved in cell wall biosynthesis
MRIGLLTEGGYPYATGESALWCDRLVRGLAPHTFDVYALTGDAGQEPAGRLPLPPHVRAVRTATLGDAEGEGPDGRGGRSARCGYGRRERGRFEAAFADLAYGVCAGDADTGAGPHADPAERFAAGLYALAELARAHGGLPAALRSETAVRVLESACRVPGARRTLAAATLPDQLAVVERWERLLRPLSLDWYDASDGLGRVDLCHAASAGAAALPGLVAKRFFGTPLLVTEHGSRLRAHYLATTGAPFTTPVRALLAAFHGRLAGEAYRRADLLTPGNAHTRRWQERCGADPDRLRTVHPGMDAERFAETGEHEDSGDPATLAWIGRVEPAKDLVALLHAFAAIRRRQPDVRLRIIAAPVRDADAAGYLALCRSLAAQLFPAEAAGAPALGESPVSFEELGSPEAPTLEDAYAASAVVVLSSVAEGFPVGLVEAMFCARATVSTDVGAVVEVVGGTGLVVPPRNPTALADACLALLRDPGRRHRLGAAARARALELFTVEQNLAAYRGLYLELLSHAPVRHRAAPGVPFAHPAESHVPGGWADRPAAGPAAPTTSAPVTATATTVAAAPGDPDA